MSRHVQQLNEMPRTNSLSDLGATIRRVSTAKQVAGVLRTAILEGRLLPGMPLGEVQLAQELGVSRNSVREAARILEGEYLVRYEMNRGTVVAEFTDEEIDDLFAAREVVELAGVHAIQGLTPKERAAYFEPFVSQIEAAHERDDTVAAAAADEAFHTALVARTGNAHLIRWYAALRNELRLALVLSEQRRAELGRDNSKASRDRNDHRRLARALQSSEPAAVQALSEHLTDGAAELHRLRELLGLSTRSGVASL
jgi:DNA-binding GntR family transcriptional regulator